MTEWVLHSCVVLSLTFGSGKYVHTCAIPRHNALPPTLFYQLKHVTISCKVNTGNEASSDANKLSVCYFFTANESGQCVSREEFQALREQLGRSREETAAVKREVDSWQNSTILILKRYLIENPSKLTKTVFPCVQICYRVDYSAKYITKL